MKKFKRSAKNALSTLLAVLMLLSVFSVAAPVAFADSETLAAEDIQEIILDPITLIEDYDSVITTDEVDSSPVDWKKYFYDNKINGEVHLKNGQTFFVEGNEFRDSDGNLYSFTLSDNQSAENEWLPGNDYKAYVDYDGATAFVDVTIEENPVESVTFNDTDVYDFFNTNNELDSSIYYYTPDYSVKLKSGEVLTPGEQGDVKIGGTWMYPTVTDNQYEGSGWTVGNTYTARGRFMGFESDFKVNVKENPVKSVVISNVEVIDGIDSYTNTSWDEYENPTRWKAYSYHSPKYSVEMKNGETLDSDEDGDIKIMGRWYSLNYNDGQSAESEWSVGTHKVDATFCGVKSSFEVTVKPSPVKSLEISDATIYKGFDEYTRYDDDDSEYSVYSYTPEYTVTLLDGTKLHSEDGYVKIGDKEVKPEFEDDQDAGNTWTLGKHIVRGSIGDVYDEFSVVLEDNPVVKIEPKDKTAQKGVDTRYKFDDEGNWFRAVDSSTKCRVTFVDGTTYISNFENQIKFHGSYRSLEFTDDQTRDKLWDVGVHTATVSYGDISADYKVNVTASPFTKLEVEDVVVYKDLDSYLEYDGDEDYDGTICYRFNPAFKLTDAEGKVVESEKVGDYENAVSYNDSRYTLEFDDDQMPFGWDLGVHKVTARILGVEAEFNVEVKENPVESIEAKDIKLYENVDGDFIEDDITYFYYTVTKGEFVVHLKGGDTIESEDGAVVFNNNKYFADFEGLKQSSANPLKAGDKQAVKGTLMGREFTADVEIVASPIKSIEIEPVKLYAGADCYMDYDEDADDYYNYYSISPEYVKCKVTLKDDSVIESEYGQIKYNGAVYDIYTKTNQSCSNEWGAGTHKATAFVMGQEVEFDVVISEYPVKRVEIADIVYDEETNGYYDDYYYYDVTPAEFTVILKDDTELKSKDGYIEIDGRCFSLNDIKTNQSSENPWLPGKTYLVTAKFLGVEGEFNVTIKAKEEPDFPPQPSTSKIPETTAPTESTEPTTVEPQETTAPVTEAVTNAPSTDATSETTVAPTEATTAPATQAPEVKTTLTLNKSKATVYVKKSTTIPYTLINPVGKATFKSLNTKVAKVSSKGKVTGVKKGKTVITVSNNGVTKRFTITVKNPKLNKTKKTLKKGKTFKIKITGLVGKAKFKSGNKKVAKVSKKGKITALKKGNATITVTANGVKLKFKLKVK